MSFLSFIKSLGHCPDELANNPKKLNEVHLDYQISAHMKTKKGNIKPKR